MADIKLDDSGFHYPDYATLLQEAQDGARGIFGPDINVDPDSMDGQYLAITQLAAYDLCQIVAALYAGFSPATAGGDALTRNVKINGIARKLATYSTADLRIVGQPHSIISNGTAKDAAGNVWVLPAQVVIPAAGELVVTATAQKPGAIAAAAGSITKINTPTLGWQTVSNAAAATVGRDAETDAELRARQAVSTMQASQGGTESLLGSLLGTPGVTRADVLENPTGTAQAGTGISPHSIACVVEGGDAAAIARVILANKSLGCGMDGSTSQAVVDSRGHTHTMKFYRPSLLDIKVEVTIKAKSTYLSATADLIKQAVADHINALALGEDVSVPLLYVPVSLQGQSEATSYTITSVKAAIGSDTLGTTDLVIGFHEAAHCTPAMVTVNAS